MPRQRTIDRRTLFQETEKLIMEEGYHSFHFKALSERLGVARSTIYNYYAKKEELVTAYMLDKLEHVFAQLDEADRQPDFSIRMKAYIRVWVQQASVHHAFDIFPVMDHHASAQVEINVEQLQQYLGMLGSRAYTLIEAGKRAGAIRGDLPTHGITRMLMVSVQAPDPSLNEEEWVETIYNIFLNGIRHP